MKRTLPVPGPVIADTSHGDTPLTTGCPAREVALRLHPLMKRAPATQPAPAAHEDPLRV